jgi:hypothetical protein
MEIRKIMNTNTAVAIKGPDIDRKLSLAVSHRGKVRRMKPRINHGSENRSGKIEKKSSIATLVRGSRRCTHESPSTFDMKFRTFTFPIVPFPVFLGRVPQRKAANTLP